MSQRGRVYNEAALRVEVEAALEELEEAESLIRKSRSPRVYISLAGGVCVEVDRDEALEYIAERRARLKSLLAALSRASG
ncbi:MAG: hypothetical protein LRS49_05245 [Desulfurococcales archaeon]|nr:hypothetical protein [Desulfurococcales archaeon]